MTPKRWQGARQVFEQALETPEGSRAALLDEVCGGDGELRAEVESLLQHHERLDDSFLEPGGVRLCLVPARPEPWAESLIGRKIARYTITRLIGHGGMGCVFQAMQDQPARAVALKVLQPGFCTPSALARFRLEPEVLGRLQHPNIAQVYEAGVHEDERGAVPYFAMEFIADAQPLREYADAHELTTRQRLELFAKVCDAVHHGHQKGIIHRDLKPANILVGLDGEPKVIDFGVARSTDADIVMTTQYTHVGDLVGTIHYMSPEQCDGDPAAIDTRTDIYSLGVVLYEILTGAAPYDTSGTTVYAAVRVIKDELPRRPSTVIGWDGRPGWDGRLARQLRGDLDAILLKALEKEPARRYVSAADLARDIRRHLSGEPIEARRPGPWRRALLWAGRRPRSAAAISAAAFFGLSALATVVSASAYVWHYFREPVAIAPDNAKGVPEVSVLNRRGLPIHTWGAGANGWVFAQLVQPFAEDPRRKLALVGFSTGSLPDLACQLYAYDLRGDLNRPLWARRLQPRDLPEALQRDGTRADQFSPTDIWTFDIFPEAGQPRIDEIVCRFSHNTSSLRELCVLRATDGELLYRVWHDGSFACHWLSGRKLLVVAGDNWEKFPQDRGCPKATPDAPNMLVVFALRPQRGAIAPRLLDTSHPDAGGELVWYKWLSVCPVPGIGWAWHLEPPPDGDVSLVAVLGLDFKTDPPCGMSWRIDADGTQIEGTLVAPSYIMARSLNPDLPPIEEFRLEDAPPGQ